MTLKNVKQFVWHTGAVILITCFMMPAVQAQVLQGFENPGKFADISESTEFRSSESSNFESTFQQVSEQSTSVPIARAAWAYVDANMDPQTGLVRATEENNVVSLWDFGNAIAAIESARTLNLISKSDYDQKIRRLIRSLAEIETFSGLPNHLIDLRTGRHPEVKVSPRGVQSKDLAYLLIWLEAVKRNTPYLANPIDTLVASWNFCGVRQADGQFINLLQVKDKTVSQPVQGLGYDAFTRKAFSLWGFSTHQSSSTSIKKHQVLGIDIPIPVANRGDESTLVYTETFLLDGLLFGWDQPTDISSDLLEFTDGWRAEMAHRLYQIQYERYQQTGVLTARASHYDRTSTSVPNSGNGLSYINQPLVDRGIAFKTMDTNQIPQPKLAGISTKAAFSTWALWDTAYTRLLLESVSDTYDRSRGFPEGIYENYGGQIDVYSLDTNAAVLMSLAFKHGGVLLPKQNTSAPSRWNKLRQSSKLQTRLCLPKPTFNVDQGLNYDPFASIDTVHADVNAQQALSYQHCDVNQDVASAQTGVKIVSNCRFFRQ